MKKSFRFYLQLAFTLLVCAFLIVPVALSILAGVTENFFIGLSSGLTWRWVGQVWDTYQLTIWRSVAIALACLAVGLADSYASMRLEVGSAYTLIFFLLEMVQLRGLSHRRIDQLSGGQRQRVALARDGRLQFPGGMLPFDKPAGGPARGAAAAAVADTGTLMFRPEDVEIVVDGTAGADMLGTVISTFFMGDRTRLQVEVGLERPIVVETRWRTSWQAGERIALRVPEHALLHLEEGETT